jgi:hypothetical protein
MRGSTLPIRATPSSSAFQYQPLASPSTEIRLVILHPSATESEEVRCDLQTLDIAEAYDYDALSYAWGDASITGSIVLSGHPFTVTANLSHALRSLRHQTNNPSQTRLLWIDAICINQTDDEERSEQVQRMCSIYKSASGVLVWLGRCHEDEDADVQFNHEIWEFEDLENGSEDTTRKAFELAEKLSKYKEEDDDPLDSNSEDSESVPITDQRDQR